MENNDLQVLEQRIDELITVCRTLAEENRQLREERISLLEKTEQARSRIESMIARLQAIEEAGSL